AKGDTSNPQYAAAQAEYETEYQQTTARKTQYDQMYAQVKSSHETISGLLKKEDYSKEELNGIKSEDEAIKTAKNVIVGYAYGNGFDSAPAFMDALKGGIDYFTDKLNYNINKEFKGRKTGDNPDDFSQKFYGNGNVKHSEKGESHGTHVAGIIAAERNNGKGANGVANNVQIMAIRAVPNGDEYDKDVALAIRYAVDNGASVINTSFG